MAEVIIKDVEKVYPGGFKAVKGINLDIHDSEFIVLVGPSGCGKSTTLRMVAGLEEISGGTVSIGDRVVNDVPPKDRDIAMVFQNYALYPHMSVYKNMAFGLKLRGMKKPDIDERVRWASSILGLDTLLERKPKALSGGQRQRVAVGRAIVRQPAAFLFDEPLSNLDAKLRVETRAELKRLHHKLQTTTIYVTHDQEEAMTLGDRVVVMSEGLIQQVDAPLTVYERPVNRFVAGFLGTPPMNFLSGALTSKNGGVFFEGEGVSLKLNEEQADNVASHIGQDVTLGLRPEGVYMHANEHANDEDRTAELEVNVIEPLGDTMDLFLDTSTGARLVARVKAEHLDLGTKVKMYVDPTKIHIFEPGEYGNNISLTEVKEAVTA
ncbi:Trehalose import ATP-binding protein SugC [Poriferisphaera corsica]|uniref:Trehalose import ATP-binding protein SugC n=1 Tax=Poriferisphaera corsica TaxID=2528020 RepID=A0A517YXF7_9BACT|nr:sn-glycerol-3-phosphate ABC transporter ATP-binding protein UgpC [Poriferisphaera corsica]QDU34904.1 Trehalose import ATP-binding protein SugC [Poriferisphaera corsica]